MKILTTCFLLSAISIIPSTSNATPKNFVQVITGICGIPPVFEEYQNYECPIITFQDDIVEAQCMVSISHIHQKARYNVPHSETSSSVETSFHVQLNPWKVTFNKKDLLISGQIASAKGKVAVEGLSFMCISYK